MDERRMPRATEEEEEEEDVSISVEYSISPLAIEFAHQDKVSA
jgi:hypothetical protein